MCLKQFTAAKFAENVIKCILGSEENDHVWSGFKPAAVANVPSNNASKTEKERRVGMFVTIE